MSNVRPALRALVPPKRTREGKREQPKPEMSTESLDILYQALSSAHERGEITSQQYRMTRYELDGLV